VTIELFQWRLYGEIMSIMAYKVMHHCILIYGDHDMHICNNIMQYNASEVAIICSYIMYVSFMVSLYYDQIGIIWNNGHCIMTYWQQKTCFFIASRKLPYPGAQLRFPLG
jgi:hypothetical protein